MAALEPPTAKLFIQQTGESTVLYMPYATGRHACLHGDSCIHDSSSVASWCGYTLTLFLFLYFQFGRFLFFKCFGHTIDIKCSHLIDLNFPKLFTRKGYYGHNPRPYGTVDYVTSCGSGNETIYQPLGLTSFSLSSFKI